MTKPLIDAVREAERLLVEHLGDSAARGPVPENRLARAQKMLTRALAEQEAGACAAGPTTCRKCLRVVTTERYCPSCGCGDFQTPVNLATLAAVSAPPAVAPSDITAGLMEMLRSRDEHGQRKYGTTLDRDDLSFDDWMQHLLEELLDAAGYVQCARRKAKERG